MQKHLANLTILQPKTDGSAGSWHLTWNQWKAARQRRKIEGARADMASQLTPRTLDDIGETDCRRRRPIFRHA